jgi:hypothetical protein
MGSYRPRPNSWKKSRQKSLVLLALYSNLYSFALRFLFLQIHATSSGFYSSVLYCILYTVKEKGGKPDRKPYPPSLPYDLRYPYRNLKLENSQDYVQTSTKWYVHEFGFWSNTPIPPPSPPLGHTPTPKLEILNVNKLSINKLDMK